MRRCRKCLSSDIAGADGGTYHNAYVCNTCGYKVTIHKLGDNEDEKNSASGKKTFEENFQERESLEESINRKTRGKVGTYTRSYGA